MRASSTATLWTYPAPEFDCTASTVFFFFSGKAMPSPIPVTPTHTSMMNLSLAYQGAAYGPARSSGRGNTAMRLETGDERRRATSVDDLAARRLRGMAPVSMPSPFSFASAIARRRVS